MKVLGISKRTIAALVAVLLVMTACGSSSKSGGGSDADAADPNAILRVGFDFVGSLGPAFDPAGYNSTSNHPVEVMYDTLLYQSPEGLKPGLAEKWAFPDASTVDITLRKNLKFQDGTPLDAAALKFSWDRVIATPASVSGAKDGTMTKVAGIAAMQSTEIINGDTVRLHLKTPVAGDYRDRFLFEAMTGLSPVSPTAVKTKGDAAIKSGVPSDSGAGPYKLTEYVPGQKISFRKWDGYWNPAGQKLGGVDFIQVAAGATTTNALTSGTVDMIYPSGADAKAIVAQGFSVTPYIVAISSDWLTFCGTQPYVDKLEVRQAISYALNRKDFLDTAYFGYGEATGSFLPSNSVFRDKNYKEFYPQDIAKAKSLLASAGVPAGAKLTFITSTTPVDAAFAQVLQSQLQAIGLGLDIIQQANPFASLPTTKWSMQRTAGASSFTSVTAYIIAGGVGNPCNTEDAAVTAALNQARDTAKTTEQLKAAWQAFDKINAEKVMLIPIVKSSLLTALAKKVKGLSGNLDISKLYPNALGELYITK